MSELLDSFPGDPQPWLDRAGCHAAIESPPKEPEQRLLFSLLEAIGYDCWNMGDAPAEWEPIEAWIWEHRKELCALKGVPPPDYLSLVLGKYTWLTTP